MTIIKPPFVNLITGKVELGYTDRGGLGLDLADARMLYEHLEGVLRDAPWPRLTVVVTEQEFQRFRCPWPACDTTFMEVAVEDIGSRVTHLDTDWESRTVHSDYDQFGEYQTLFYTCPNCGDAVRLPEGWTEK